MSDLHSVAVISIDETGGRQVLLTLDTEHTSVRHSHRVAGQYVKLALYADDVVRPYAVASKPGAPNLEILVKAPAERLAQLVGLKSGDRVHMSACLGNGYNMEALRGRHVWLVGVGSGIAPLRSCLEVMLDERMAYQDITLLYGVRDPTELVFQARFGQWAGLGVRVVPVVSGAHVADGDWAGARGHVQNHLPASLPHPDHTVAVVCGLPEMEKAVAAALLERGVGPDRVLRNW